MLVIKMLGVYMRILVISFVVCLCSAIVAGFLAFQLNSDGYYLGWANGIVEACADGCPALKLGDFSLAKTLAAEDGEFRQGLHSKWFVFLSVVALVVVSSLSGLVATIQKSKGKSSNV